MVTLRIGRVIGDAGEGAEVNAAAGAGTDLGGLGRSQGRREREGGEGNDANGHGDLFSSVAELLDPAVDRNVLCTAA